MVATSARRKLPIILATATLSATCSLCTIGDSRSGTYILSHYQIFLCCSVVGDGTMHGAFDRDQETVRLEDSEILVGKPVIKGTRTHNPDFDELFADYPRLTMDDVKACFAYAQTLVEATSKQNELAAPPVR
jgi:uncharacterized protein (DUF433 family)